MLFSVPQSDKQGPKVLIVDDDHAPLELFDAYLGRAGFQVIKARGGHEAITLAIQEMPQVIVLDILLPGMGGLEALKQLKSSDLTKAIPVIIVTAGGDAEAKQQSGLTGAAAFLAKPLSPAKLLAEINRLIDCR